jgi:hypothetical protein
MHDVDIKERRGITAAAKHHPDNPWTVDVDVYLYSVGPPAEFTVDTCLPVELDCDDPHGRIVFRNNGRDGFNLVFRLFDNTNGGEGSGYVFPDPPGPKHVSDHNKWALWSKEGEGCPPAGYADQWSEFTSTSVTDQGQTLIVRNKNSTRTLFGYTLRVTNDDGQTFVNLDPGGNNMNGNSRQ